MSNIKHYLILNIFGFHSFLVYLPPLSLSNGAIQCTKTHMGAASPFSIVRTQYSAFQLRAEQSTLQCLFLMQKHTHTQCTLISKQDKNVFLACQPNLSKENIHD